MVELLNVLRPHWEAHQKNSESNDVSSIQTRVKRVQKDLGEYALATGKDAMTIDATATSATPSPFVQELSQCLLVFLDCSVASILETDGASKDASDAVLELTAAVAAATSVDACNTLLARATHLSETTHMDNVRVLACRVIGWIVYYIFHQSKHPTSVYNDSLDAASQALQPRFTDMMQSVRMAAIQAAGQFFVKNDDSTDPDLLQAMLWCLQHDPSVANRVAAVESLPITLETVDFVVQRVRDIKQKVRIAALQALRFKCKDLSLLEPLQCAAIVEVGYTERCAATKEATEQLVCLGWMKLTKYDPIELLRHVSVVEQGSVCDSVVSMLLKADDTLLAELSDPESRAFRAAIKDATISLSALSSPGETGTSTSSVRLFFSVASCKHATTPQEKESLISELIPDISVLCQVLEQETGKLIQAIEAQNTQAEDESMSICVQLLQVAALADHEEGSRRLLATALHRLLVQIITPDDLIEEAVKTLKSVCRDDTSFVDQVATICRELDILAEHNDGLSINHKLRVLSILTVLFELIAPKQTGNPMLEELSSFILPVVTHDNSLIREAAVSCIGKLGLFMPVSRIATDFEPLLLQILSNEKEKSEIRAQAMLGMADWSLLHKMHPNFAASISQALTRTPYPKGLVCIAAEIAAKLLLVEKTEDQAWLAVLLVILFDPSTDTDDDEEEVGDVTEVGSVVRVHQILTLFFPLYCLKHNSVDRLTGSVSAVLDQVQEQQSELKKSRKSFGRKSSSKSTWPIAKMLDYIVETCEHATKGVNKAQQAEIEEGSNTDTADNESIEERKNDNAEVVEISSSSSSTVLLAAIQVARYVENNMDDLSVPFRRSLCKWLGTVYVDCEAEVPRQLVELKNTLDELEMAMDDAASSRSLSPLISLLADVSAVSTDEEGDNNDDDVSTEEEDQDSLEEASDEVELESVTSPATEMENGARVRVRRKCVIRDSEEEQEEFSEEVDTSEDDQDSSVEAEEVEMESVTFPATEKENRARGRPSRKSVNRDSSGEEGSSEEEEFSEEEEEFSEEDSWENDQDSSLEAIDEVEMESVTSPTTETENRARGRPSRKSVNRDSSGEEGSSEEEEFSEEVDTSEDDRYSSVEAVDEVELESVTSPATEKENRARDRPSRKSVNRDSVRSRRRRSLENRGVN